MTLDIHLKHTDIFAASGQQRTEQSTIFISLKTAVFTFAVPAAASAPPVCDRSDGACDEEDDDVDRA